MTNSGFVKIPRKLLDWRWYGSPNVRLVFFDLLLMAEWTDRNHFGVQLSRGQVAVSVAELATRNQLTVQQTRTALDHLKSTGDITTEKNSKFTIITLNFYDDFQGVNKPDNAQITSAYSQTQQAPVEKINEPTYNKKKEIQEERIRTPAARVVNNNFSSKKSVRSDNASFTFEDIMNKINSR